MALSCNSTDLLQTAYAAGYAKLSERELMASGVAAMMVMLYMQSGNATDTLALCYSMGLPKLTERDLDAAFAGLMCSLTG